MSSHVLVVDDDPAVLEVLSRQLEEYEVTTATSAAEALKAVRRNGLDLVVADVRMPGTDGVKLLETIKRLRPDVARFILTGFTDAHAQEAARAPDGVYKFKKPWGEELIVAIRRALESRETVVRLRRRLGMLLRWLELAADLALRRETEEILASLGRWLESLPAVRQVECYVLRSAMLECVHASGRLTDVSLYESDTPLVRCITEGRGTRRVGDCVEWTQCVGEAAARGVVRLMSENGDAETWPLVDHALAVTTLAMRNGGVHGPGRTIPESFDLRGLQRQATLGGLFASIVHEMNNPLSAVLAHLEMLQIDRGQDPVVAEHLRVLIPQLQRVTGILERARRIAHPPTDRLVPVDVTETLKSVVELVDYHYRSQGVTITLKTPEKPVRVTGSGPMLQQVWPNLVKNAFEAVMTKAERDGRIDVSLNTDPATREAVVTVSDNGVGMSRDVLKQLRSRPEFFTTKPEGLGLGVSESRRIIIQHGGTLEYNSHPKKDTTATVRLKLMS